MWFPSTINHFPLENSIGGLETHCSFLYWGMTWHAGTRPRGWRLRDDEGRGEKPRGELPSCAGNWLPPGSPPPGQTPAPDQGLMEREAGGGEENAGNATCFKAFPKSLLPAGLFPGSLAAPWQRRECLPTLRLPHTALPRGRGLRTLSSWPAVGLGGPKAEEAPPAPPAMGRGHRGHV